MRDRGRATVGLCIYGRDTRRRCAGHGEDALGAKATKTAVVCHVPQAMCQYVAGKCPPFTHFVLTVVCVYVCSDASLYLRADLTSVCLGFLETDRAFSCSCDLSETPCIHSEYGARDVGSRVQEHQIDVSPLITSKLPFIFNFEPGFIVRT